jgi:AraC-like DNA-binding protein
MNGYTNWFYVFVAFFCVLGLIVSLVIFITHKGSKFLSRMLAAILFCLSYALFGYLLYITEEFLRVPHLYRTNVFFSLCVAPLCYIYIRSSLDQSFGFRKWDFLFFVPAILYTLQFIPFYLLPASEKVVIIKVALQSKSLGAREPEALLPQGIGFLLRMVYSLILIFSTFVLLIRWKRSDKGLILKINENKEIYKWLFYLSLVLASTFLSLIVGHIFLLSHFFEQYRISTLTLTFTIFFISFYLLFKPNILYGLTGWVHMPVIFEHTQTPSQEMETDLKRQSFSEEQIISYEKLVEDHFRENLPFLKQRYSIRDLSKEVGIPSYLLSAFINQQYGKNFNEFINDNRINYLIAFASENPDSLLQYTLEVLGQMGGFNSRASFIAAVKRKTGKTPSEIFGNST